MPITVGLVSRNILHILYDTYLWCLELRISVQACPQWVLLNPLGLNFTRKREHRMKDMRWNILPQDGALWTSLRSINPLQMMCMWKFIYWLKSAVNTKNKKSGSLLSSTEELRPHLCMEEKRGLRRVWPDLGSSTVVPDLIRSLPVLLTS